MDEFFQSIVVFFNNISDEFCLMFNINSDNDNKTLYHEISYTCDSENSYPKLTWALNDDDE